MTSEPGGSQWRSHFHHSVQTGSSWSQVGEGEESVSLGWTQFSFHMKKDNAFSVSLLPLRMTDSLVRKNLHKESLVVLQRKRADA